jgi:hypothetical protein
MFLNIAGKRAAPEQKVLEKNERYYCVLYFTK